MKLNHLPKEGENLYFDDKNYRVIGKCAGKFTCKIRSHYNNIVHVYSLYDNIKSMMYNQMGFCENCMTGFIYLGDIQIQGLKKCNHK